MSFAENVNATSRFIRTVVGTVVIGALGYGGGWIYTQYHPNGRLAEKERQLSEARTSLAAAQQTAADQAMRIEQMDQELAARAAVIDRLDTAMRLLKVDQRVAEILVPPQEQLLRNGETWTEFFFRELDRDGRPVGSAEPFRIAGDLLYIDFLVVKFADEYVERADLDRATSICLFRRLFGEFQEPNDGFSLDAVGSRPMVYGSERTMSEHEVGIWRDFWTIAMDPQRAALMGIRAAHGEAVATKLRPGKRYRITLRASDGLTISPPEEFEPREESARM